MIRVICSSNQIIYYAYHLVKAFYPDREVTSEVNPCQETPVRLEGEVVLDRVDGERSLYESLRNLTGQDLPWGMLTGVRPTKLASGWLREHPKAKQQSGMEEFAEWFGRERFVSREKAELAYRIAWKERELSPEDFRSRKYLPGWRLYIGIPFCPSICSYCSFSSGAIGKYRDRVDPYLDALFNEMRQKKEGFGIPSTVYIGGGTPTSLETQQLKRLLDEADSVFGIAEGLACGVIREYTVEAGRPDSITRDKLEVLRQHGVTRISINPQSMQPKTLQAIGRSHSVEQVREAFRMAREMGFDNINMDLIMGLPGETNEDVRDTLRQIREMGPDSLTVHSLAIKRSSAMGIAKKLSRREESGQPADLQEGDGPSDISRMIRDAYDCAGEMGMEPYYLYRQKSIAGNFENIGYARPGKEGLYNILIIEELQSIIGCGAGSSTKIVSEEEIPNPARNGQMTHMIRSENVKNIEEYILRFGG